MHVINALATAVRRVTDIVLVIAVCALVGALALVVTRAGGFREAAAFAAAVPTVDEDLAAVKVENTLAVEAYNAGRRAEGMARLMTIQSSVQAHPVLGQAIQLRQALYQTAWEMERNAWWWEKPTGWSAALARR